MGTINFLETAYEYKKIKKDISKKVSVQTINKEIIELQKEVVRRYQKEISEIKNRNMKRTVLESKITDVIDEFGIVYEEVNRDELIKIVMDEIFGYSILQKYIDDPEVNDIMVNNKDTIFVRKGMTDIQVPEKFMSDKAYTEFLYKICAFVGCKLNESNPKVDGTDDYYNLRINIMMNPITTYSPSLIIRKSHVSIDYDKVISDECYPKEIIKTLDLMKNAGCRVIISGPMESGKTTFMNAYLNDIKDERIIVMEDTEELHISSPNTVYMKTIEGKNSEQVNVTLSDLVKNFKRTNGTMPVVSEVRGQEAVELLDVFNAGFTRGCTSIHANSATDVIRQLVFQMKASNKLGTDRKELEEYISRTIDIIIYMEKRKIVDIAEVYYDFEKERIEIKSLHYFDIQSETKNEISGEYRTCVSPFSDKMIDRIRRAGLINEIPEGMKSQSKI